MSVPPWVADAIFYQIFPDRFANGDPENDPANTQPWGSPPVAWGFQGGDLKGIRDRLEYLVELGVNAIYLNPIFQATSTHRYNTTDYYTIDPKLGDLQAFRQLLEDAHERGIRIILDGVFNHCGRGFFAFNDVLENGIHSPYKDWFLIHHFPVDAYSPGEAKHYEAWWNLKSLPKFNTDHPAVRRYLFDVARHWIEVGADGWRLDVPNEIDDDAFWAEFRQVVKVANPEAYLLGEIWEADARWVGEQHFDGVMNYPVRDALLDVLVREKLTPSKFAKRLDHLLELYPPEHTLAHFVPLGTHDTERIITLCQGDARKVELAFLFQMTYPGAPGVYYGDEIGLPGGEDPDSRRAFPWDRARWNRELRGSVKALIHLRRSLPELRRGSYEAVMADDSNGVFAARRSLEGRSCLVIMNTSDSARHVRMTLTDARLETGSPLMSFARGGDAVVRGGAVELDLPAYGGDLIYHKR